MFGVMMVDRVCREAYLPSDPSLATLLTTIQQPPLAPLGPDGAPLRVTLSSNKARLVTPT